MTKVMRKINKKDKKQYRACMEQVKLSRRERLVKKRVKGREGSRKRDKTAACYSLVCLETEGPVASPEHLTAWAQCRPRGAQSRPRLLGSECCSEWLEGSGAYLDRQAGTATWLLLSATDWLHNYTVLLCKTSNNVN